VAAVGRSPRKRDRQHHSASSLRQGRSNKAEVHYEAQRL
ncbi:leucine-rich repeat protein LRR1, partial [Toxoplasma gondii MAS]